MLFHEVIRYGVQLVDVWADVDEIFAGVAAGVLVGVVGVVAERAIQGDREVFPVFPMCLWLYARVDESLPILSEQTWEILDA